MWLLEFYTIVATAFTDEQGCMELRPFCGSDAVPQDATNSFKQIVLMERANLLVVETQNSKYHIIFPKQKGKKGG